MKSCAPLTVIMAIVFSSSTNAQIIPDATVGSQVLNNININGVLSDKIDGASGRGSDVMVQTNNLRIFDRLTITAETTNKTTS